MMLARVTRWMLVAVAGVLAVGLAGLGVSDAQGPTPAAAGTPPVTCPMGLGRGMGFRWGANMPQVWADALGMTLDEFTAAVQGGKTVAGLAEEKGLTVEALVEKAIAAREAALQQAVEAGRLTQTQADALLEQMRAQMTQRLQNGACSPGATCPRLNGQGAGARGCMGGLGRGMRRSAPAKPA